MRQIPVDTSAATLMVAQPPQKKVTNRQTGQVAVDRDSGETLWTVDVLFVTNGSAEVVTVAVPEPGVSGELAMGTPVALTGLIARPWENEFNGQKRHGISFRAVAITSLAAGASKAKAA
ncbi:SCO3933 family regulatory protein [Streptomyces sp. NPDC000851]